MKLVDKKFRGPQLGLSARETEYWESSEKLEVTIIISEGLCTLFISNDSGSITDKVFHLLKYVDPGLEIKLKITHGYIMECLISVKDQVLYYIDRLESKLKDLPGVRY